MTILALSHSIWLARVAGCGNSTAAKRPWVYKLAVAMPRTWKSGYGWRPGGLPVAYRFAESELPVGDLQLIIVTDNGNVRCIVHAADRLRVW